MKMIQTDHFIKNILHKSLYSMNLSGYLTKLPYIKENSISEYPLINVHLERLMSKVCEIITSTF